MSKKFKTVDEYLGELPAGQLKYALEIRKIIRQAIPEADEVISYNMPAYKKNKILVYFAASKNHMGYYPTPAAITAFEDRLKGFSYSKGAVQFPYNKPLPADLIREMAVYRLKQEK